MKDTIVLLLVGACVIVGTFSILSISVVYWYIIIKHRKVDTIFYFLEYANEKEMFIIKLGTIGILVTAILIIAIYIVSY